MWARIINIIIGLFLMLAPTFWQFDKTASDNLYIIGPLVITNAIMAIWEVNRNFRWFNIPLGAWLLVSPLILGLKSFEAELHTLSGILIIIFSMFKGTIKKRYGGGWRSLLQKKPMHMNDE